LPRRRSQRRQRASGGEGAGGSALIGEISDSLRQGIWQGMFRGSGRFSASRRQFTKQFQHIAIIPYDSGQGIFERGQGILVPRAGNSSGGTGVAIATSDRYGRAVFGRWFRAATRNSPATALHVIRSHCFVGNILHAYSYNVNRLSFVALAPTSPRQLRDLPVEPRKVTFPNGVVRREGCHARHDGSALPQRVQRLCVLAPFPERVRTFRVRYR
jgi:hypothetical protein